MAKRLHDDRFNAQYSNTNSIADTSNVKKFSIYQIIRSGEHQRPLADAINRLNFKAFPSLPSISDQKIEVFHFGSKENQIYFIRKVYFAVSLQLILVILLKYLLELNDSFKYACRNDLDYCKWTPVAWTLFSAMILATCQFHRKHPYDYITLIYFTCIASVFVVKSAIKRELVFPCILVFTSQIFFLTIYTCQTKLKHPFYVGLSMALILFLPSFVICIIRSEFTPYFAINWAWEARVCMWTGIFLLYFVIDIQIMVSSNHKHNVKEHEHIFATMTLYSDMVNLPIYLQRFNRTY